MKNLRSSFSTPVLSLIFLISLTSGPFAAEPKPGWQADWEQTLKSSEKEGKLSVYLSTSDDLEKVLKVFQQKYPRIEILPVSGGLQVAQRILAERRAQRYIPDVVVTGPGTPYYILYQGSALDPINATFILPEVLDESKWWEGKHHYVDQEGRYVFVFNGPVSQGRIYYNTRLVKPAEFKSFQDILNPKWKGKILSIDTRLPGAARLGLREIYHMPELGPKFLRRLFTEMEITFTRDSRQAADWLSVGKFPLCLFCGDARYAKDQGLPVDELKTSQWPEAPTISPGGNSTMVLLNRAPHSNAAKVFINWFLSREGQTVFQQLMNRPDTIFDSMRTDIPKDPIHPENRRREGVKYVMMATAERADHAPVEKLLREILKQ